ncbi:hypothetical protein QJR26_16975 [Clostridium baratii]
MREITLEKLEILRYLCELKRRNNKGFAKLKEEVLKATRKVSNSELQNTINDITIDLLDKQNKICRGDI